MGDVLSTWGAYSKDDDRRIVSSSGGVFFEIAKYTLDNQGVVYGVAMSEDNKKAIYKRVNIMMDLSQLFGSKYIQSSVGNVFSNVREDLNKGLQVCFSGTGCQINGLKSFLGCEYENLTCVDVVCHGVPSPALWKKYAEYQEEKYGKITSVNFRCKNVSCRDYRLRENQVYIPKDEDLYMQMFLKNYCLRPSCYECQAKTDKRSDITIADFWGVENTAPQIDDGKGTSLIIIRTEKGKGLFNKIMGRLELQEVKYEDSVKYNPCEFESVKRPFQRDSFYIDMACLPFDKLAKKYVAISIVSKIKRIIKKFLWRVKKQGNSEYGLLFAFDKNDKRNTYSV